MAREDYEGHFCGEHDHQCEPVLGVWREQWMEKWQGNASKEDGCHTGGVGAKGTWKGKPGEDKPKDETDGGDKKSGDGNNSVVIQLLL